MRRVCVWTCDSLYSYTLTCYLCGVVVDSGIEMGVLCHLLPTRYEAATDVGAKLTNPCNHDPDGAWVCFMFNN